MQPVGPYAIHIIVKNGRTMLLGVVDNAADRQIAEVRARGDRGLRGGKQPDRGSVDFGRWRRNPTDAIV
jgi:hypothetical protein